VRPPPRRPRGISQIELLASLAIAAVLMVSVGTAVLQAMNAWSASDERNELNRQAQFAMQRITAAVLGSRRLLIPLAENPTTAWSESIRDVLAVTLDPTLDRDGDGFADADNDKDGKVDEDLPADNTNDGVAGIVGLDSNGDGLVNNGNVKDNDEDGQNGEDPLNGVDDDGDGSIDEDIPAHMAGGAQGVPFQDDDGDGQDDEDWLDVVAYYVNNGSLIERMPNINPASGNDYSEHAIASRVTTFRVQRSYTAGDRAVVLDITLVLTGASGQQVSLTTRLRVGGGQ
jgi:type II secretory pathway pseudopilin PulG